MRATKTLCIIDDDQDDIDLLKEAIASIDESIICYSFGDSQKALETMLQPGSAIPDMIFLDLNMPRVTGRQCLCEFRKRVGWEQVPIVIYSTSSYQKDINETKELGASHFFTKPSSFQELCLMLGGIISEALVRHTP